MSRVVAGVASGTQRPLPQVAHSLEAAQAALRQMSQARHVGKVVVRDAAMAANGLVLVTGGLGTLGTHVATWLAQQQVAHMRLLGRTGRLSSDAAASISLSVHHCGSAIFAGATTMMMCDAATLEEGASICSTGVPRTSRPLLGIVQAGGVLADGVLSSQTAVGLRAVSAPKMQAAVRLGSSFGCQPGTFQLLFSSVAALLGSPGQANYSAANAALDAAAQQLQQAGTVATSVQWGAWAGAGMAAGDASTASRIERTGMALVLPHQGMAVLQTLLVPREHASALMAAPVLAANAFVWDKFLRRFGSALPPFFAEFADSTSPAAASVGGIPAGHPLGGSGRHGLSAAARKAAVLAQVQDAVRSIIGSDISADEPLMAAGLDSLGAVELKNSLEARLGLQLPGTLVFDYPSAAAITSYVEAQLPADEGSEGDEMAQAPLVLSPLAGAGSIALKPVGLALLSMASRTAEDAILSLQPMDIISPVPLEHWDVEQAVQVRCIRGGSMQLTLACDQQTSKRAVAGLQSGVLSARFGGFAAATDLFDVALFGLSGNEAELMDVQQRLLLELALEVRPQLWTTLPRPAGAWSHA